MDRADTLGHGRNFDRFIALQTRKFVRFLCTELLGIFEMEEASAVDKLLMYERLRYMQIF
jgi:hypothetical protein